MSTQTRMSGGPWPLEAPSRALVLDSPFLIRFLKNPCIPNFILDHREHRSEVGCKIFPKSDFNISSSRKLISICRTKRFLKIETGWQGYNTHYDDGFWSFTAALMWFIIEFNRHPLNRFWAPVPLQGAVDLKFTNFIVPVLGELHGSLDESEI